MKANNPLQNSLGVIGLIIAGFSGGILAEQLLNEGSNPNIIIPVIGFIVAAVLIYRGQQRAEK